MSIYLRLTPEETFLRLTDKPIIHSKTLFTDGSPAILHGEQTIYIENDIFLLAVDPA
jgi:hypothetical protein